MIGIDMFDKKGTITQGIDELQRMDQLNPESLLYLILLAGLIILVLAGGFFLWIKLSKMKKNGMSNINGDYIHIRREVSIVHKRVDKVLQKQDKIFDKLDAIRDTQHEHAKDLGYLRGKIENKKGKK